MNKQRTKTKEEFWAKFVEPMDTPHRAKTLNNEPLIITGTANELWEWFDGELDKQLQRIIEELEEREDIIKQFIKTYINTTVETLKNEGCYNVSTDSVRSLMENFGNSLFNQCCALQKKRAEELKEKEL